MSKYIDADLLRKEIERHLERATAEQEKFPDMPKYRWYLREGKKELCNDLLDYMYDTLGVEEPITDSLQQEQQEEPDKSLEEAAEEYTQKMLESWRFDSTGCRPPRESFKAGAEWQKQQMLKDAVEADVMLTLHDKTGDISLHTGYLPKELGIKCDDKVRLIVLKAEEE